MAKTGEHKSSAKQENKLLNLIYSAVNMENGKGVSRQKIIKRVQEACRSQKNIKNNAKMAIIKAIENGMLIRTSGFGLNGSFRLSSDSNCELISMTMEQEDSTSNREQRQLCKKSTLAYTNVYNTSVYSNELAEPFQLKAILKAPRSNKSSGFRVRFSARSPKIFWISPRPNKRRPARRYAV